MVSQRTLYWTEEYSLPRVFVNNLTSMSICPQVFILSPMDKWNALIKKLEDSLGHTAVAISNWGMYA